MFCCANLSGFAVYFFVIFLFLNYHQHLLHPDITASSVPRLCAAYLASLAMMSAISTGVLRHQFYNMAPLKKFIDGYNV